jgi:hypothetical protein
VRRATQKRALVVDGDRWRCDAICQLLVEAGYTVAYASNGFSGLRLAECDRPNLVVLGPTLSELGVAPLLSALQANRSTRGIPVLLVDGGAGGMPGSLGADYPPLGPSTATYPTRLIARTGRYLVTHVRHQAIRLGAG